MQLYGKDTHVDASKAVEKIIYVWLGKLRWLPHLGPAYMVTGYRGDFLIAMPVYDNTNRVGERTYINKRDVAIMCDPYEEFDAIQELKSQFMKARSQVDTTFASALRKLRTDDIKQLSTVRRRKRPPSGLFYIKPVKKDLTQD